MLSSKHSLFWWYCSDAVVKHGYISYYGPWTPRNAVLRRHDSKIHPVCSSRFFCCNSESLRLLLLLHCLFRSSNQLSVPTFTNCAMTYCDQMPFHNNTTGRKRGLWATKLWCFSIGLSYVRGLLQECTQRKCNLGRWRNCIKLLLDSLKLKYVTLR